MVRYPALIDEEIPEQSDFAGLLFDDYLLDMLKECKHELAFYNGEVYDWFCKHCKKWEWDW